jgi:hypothetical protein
MIQKRTAQDRLTWLGTTSSKTECKPADFSAGHGSGEDGTEWPSWPWFMAGRYAFFRNSIKSAGRLSCGRPFRSSTAQLVMIHETCQQKKWPASHEKNGTQEIADQVTASMFMTTACLLPKFKSSLQDVPAET